MQQIINELKGIIEKRKNYIFIIICTYAIGLLLGIFITHGSERAMFTNNAVDFFVLVYSKDGNIMKLFLVRIFSGAGFLALFYALSLIGLSNGFHHVLIFYRGYVLGAVAVTFVLTFKVSGVVLFLFCIMTQNMLLSLGLTIFSAIMRENQKCGKCKIKDFRYHLIAIIICMIICLISALFELVMLFCILRPLNFYF